MLARPWTGSAHGHKIASFRTISHSLRIWVEASAKTSYGHSGQDPPGKW